MEPVASITASRNLLEPQKFWAQSLEQRAQRQISGVCGRVWQRWQRWQGVAEVQEGRWGYGGHVSKIWWVEIGWKVRERE